MKACRKAKIKTEKRPGGINIKSPAMSWVLYFQCCRHYDPIPSAFHHRQQESYLCDNPNHFLSSEVVLLPPKTPSSGQLYKGGRSVKVIKHCDLIDLANGNDSESVDSMLTPTQEGSEHYMLP